MNRTWREIAFLTRADFLISYDKPEQCEDTMKNAPNAVSFVLICLLLLSAASPVMAADMAGQLDTVNFGLGAGFGRMSGDTLYHISFFDPSTGQGGESELKFPLDTTIAGIAGTLTGQDAKQRELFSIKLQWSRNVGNGSGQLQDSDWLNDALDIATVGPPAHPGLDIFSLSDISLRADMLDLRARYSVWPTEEIAVGPLGGFMYEHFSYDASNLHQVGYGPYAASYTGSMAGTVLTYEVKYYIPYVGGHAEGMVTDSVRLGLDLGYSPYCGAEDRDDHVLRYKLSKGSTTGTAYLAAADARWEFAVSTFLSLNWQYLKITTTGSQTQTWYANEVTSTGTIPAGTTISGIDDRIESDQSTLTLLLSHQF